VTELFADLFVGEQQQLGVRQSDPANPEDGEAWLRDDLTDSANDKIGELRWYVGSATNSVPIFDAGTSGTGITEELRVQINGQTGFLPVTQSGAFPEHRIQSGGQTRTLTDTKALDVLFDILSISTNEPISVGEDLLVDYAVENTGSDQGTDDIDLLDYTDTVVDTQTKTLNSNEQTSDQLVWTTSSGDGGDRQITVRSSATSLSKTVSISAIPDSVVNRWPLDEGSGSTAADAVEANDLTINGATWQSQSDAIGGYQLSLDGTDDNLEGSTMSEISKNNAFSVAITISTDNFNNRQTVVNHQLSDSDRFAVTIETDGEVSAGLYDGSSYVANASAAISTTTRHRVVYTHDGALNGTVYVDAVRATSGQTPAAFGSGFTIGSRNADDQYFAGLIDEPLVANAEWSQSTVDDDYNRQPWTV